MKFRIVTIFQRNVLLIFFSLHCGNIFAQDTSSLRLPFSENETWYVCQGYNGPISHRNAFAFDLSIAVDSTTGPTGCSDATTNASTGRAVLAPGAGNLVRQNTNDLVCIDLDRGGSILIGHLSDRHLNGRVLAGEHIGLVAGPNANNRGYAHIHIQGHARAGCTASGGATIPFDNTHGMQLQGMPELPDIGGENQFRRIALARGVNVIRNGAFERGINPWISPPDGNPPAVVDSGTRHTGSNAVRIGGPNNQGLEPSGVSVVFQKFWIPADANLINISFWYWPWSNDTSANDTQELVLEDYPEGTSFRTLQTLIKVNEDVSRSSRDWKYKVVTVDVSAHRHKILGVAFLTRQNANGRATGMYIDDVFVHLIPYRLPLGTSADEQQAASDIQQRAFLDSRFSDLIFASLTTFADWHPRWDLRGMLFHFSKERVIAVYQITSRLNRSRRFTTFFDPDRNGWTSWEQAQ